MKWYLEKINDVARGDRYCTNRSEKAENVCSKKRDNILVCDLAQILNECCCGFFDMDIVAKLGMNPNVLTKFKVLPGSKGKVRKAERKREEYQN